MRRPPRRLSRSSSNSLRSKPPELPRPEARARSLPLRWIPLVGLIAAAIVTAIAFRHSPGANALQPLPPPHITPAAPQRPAGEPATPPAAAAQASSEPASIWRVIVYEYSGRVLAEQKARRLNEQRPTWRAEVFAPRGNRGPYLVSLGGRMSRGDAERVKRDARAHGLPRDTFVRNYSN